MNLLITGAWENASDYIDKIKGHDICFMQYERDSLPCEETWIQGIVCNGFFLHHDIRSLPNLRYIQLTSVGYDRVDMEYVTEKGICIHNARGAYSVPMAEFALAEVLALYKELDGFRNQQKHHKWVKNRRIRELAGSRVLVVGCGSVGTECAKRFKALGCVVCGIDNTFRGMSLQNSRTSSSPEVKNIIGACDRFDLDLYYDERKPPESLDDELKRADVIILTIPMTMETCGLINGERLKHVRGILVNIARGGIIDQKALEAWDGTAVLDVFEEEPLPKDSPIWDKEHFIITPHNSFVGEGNGERLSKIIMGNLEDVI